MGKNKCVDVGYAYFLNFAYTFCENIDKLSKIYVNGLAAWTTSSGNLEAVPSSATFMTGKSGDIAGSGTGKSIVKIYSGDHTSIPEMNTWTGKTIGYKNTCTFIYPQAFIGDNVQQVPHYSILASNQTFNTISGHAIIRENANPIDIIYDILIRDLKLSSGTIDTDSFISAGTTVYNEGIGVGLVMSTERKVMDWIESLLKIVDGVIFVDSVTNKTTVKLLRNDYVVGDLIVLDDSNTSAQALESVSWAETYNKFVFKYTNIANGKLTSVEFINTASRLALGYDRVKAISFPEINEGFVLNAVANRVIAKMGIPLAGLKLVVDYIDWPGLNVGDVFKYTSSRLGVTDRIFRIMKITGDNEDSTSINIEALEDVFGKSYSVDMPDNDSGFLAPVVDYTISAVPKRTFIKDAGRETSENNSIYWAGTSPSADTFVLGISAEQSGGAKASTTPFSYGTLASAIPEDIKGENGAIVSSSEHNREYQVTINDVDGDLFEIFGSNASLQTLRNVGVIGNEEVAFKTLEDIGGGQYRLTGLIRGINDTDIVAHAIGTAFFVSREAGRLTSDLVINTDTPTIKMYAYNHVSVGPSTPQVYSYNNTIDKPYKPVPWQSQVSPDRIISWRPRVALSGANYRSADDIVGGVDEGTVMGYYEVKLPDTTVIKVTPVNGDTVINYTTTTPGTHYVRHVNAQTYRAEAWQSVYIS